MDTRSAAGASTTTTTGQVVTIPFHGQSIQAMDIDGTPYVVFRRVVESLGLDWATQLAKLRGRSWVSRRDIPTTGADGKTYKMVTVSVSTLLMWLATVNENKVAEGVRELLIAYQVESADAITKYWTKGVAVNPRYSLAEQAEVLAILRPIVDAGWLETKARQVAGKVLGELPEYDEAIKPLTVSTYLEQLGLTRSRITKICGQFGRELKKKYVARYGTNPPTMEDLVGRHMVPVYQYQEQHRPMFDEVWQTMSSGTALPG